MREQIERRRAERRQADGKMEEELPPEYLALLEVCGGEIRASDRAALAERRQAAGNDAASPEGERPVGAEGTLPATDRRRARG